MGLARGKYKYMDISWKKIIHFEIQIDNEPRYLCNQAVSTFPQKRTTDKTRVICTRCLNKIKDDKTQK